MYLLTRACKEIVKGGKYTIKILVNDEQPLHRNFLISSLQMFRIMPLILLAVTSVLHSHSPLYSSAVLHNKPLNSLQAYLQQL